MGQKVNPKSYRLGTTRTWNSKWFSDKNFADQLQEDTMIRKVVGKKLKNSGVSDVEIERSGDNLKIIVFAAKPGLIIGRGGAGVEQLKQEIEKKVFAKIYNPSTRPHGTRSLRQGSGQAGQGRPKYAIDISIQEVKDAGLSAQVVSEEIIADIEKRIPFRRVMKQAVDKVKKAGAKGTRMTIAGRLNGADIARTEKFTWGNIPLHTLRADIDYARGAAKTIYGAIGVKVWIYKGDVFKRKSDVGSRTSDDKS